MVKFLLNVGLISSLIVLLNFNATAQQVCAFDERHQHLLNTDPEYKKRIDEMEKSWQEYVADPQNPKRTLIEGADTIFEIPVVVHVINTGAPVGTNYNRSDDDIEAWVNYTNQIFAGTAPGYVGEGAGGSKIPVRLVLAKRTIDCEPTNGIVRIDASSNSTYVANGVRASSSVGITETALYGMSRWNTDYYYNIYLVNKINGEDGYTSSSYIAGFAYFPGTPTSLDGSVMLSYIAEDGESTFAHEMGHAFGLYHTFEGASSYTTCPPSETSATCSTIGDRICDTERGRALLGVWPCPTSSSTNPCTSAPYAGVQYNVMNYSNCPNRFTPGQSDRAMFQLLEYRSQLVNSLAGMEIEDIAPISLTAACDISPNTNPSSYGTGPVRVQLESLDVASTGKISPSAPHYIDYSTYSCIDERSTATLMQGGNYTLTVTTELYNQFLKVYLDYNNDGVFNEAEEMIYDEIVAAGSTDILFTVPMSAVGETAIRMRIRADDEYASSPSTACVALEYGQTEDYAVFIMAAPLNQSEKSFSAEIKNCSVNLNWNISDPRFLIETIELEKSIDGKNFNTIDNILVNKYIDIRKIVDTDLNSDQIYYRLKINNILGNTSYSQVEYVKVDCKNELVVYPNPNSGQFTVQFSAPQVDNYVITVHNILGKRVGEYYYQSVKGINVAPLDLYNLSDGLYFIHVTNGQTQYKSTINIIK